MPQFALVPQPDAITCGPTCLRMLADRHGCARGLSVLSLGDLCGTNPRTGTVDTAMTKGLSALGLSWREHAPGSPTMVADALEAGSGVLLRTLTHGIPHWVLAVGQLPDGRFRVMDPWLGELALDVDEMDARCRPRGWQVFEVPSAQNPANFLRIGDLRHGWTQAISLAEDAFSSVYPRELIANELATSDPALSRSLWVGNEMVAAYFLSESPAPIAEFDGLKGVCGEGLVVANAHRGRGFGSLLRALPARMGVDYVWGCQLKALDNLDDWLKRRVIIGESKGAWATLEAVSPAAQAALTASNAAPAPGVGRRG